MDLIRLKTFRLHGAAKFFHTLFMIVTYPLRHIFVFLTSVVIFLAVLIALPMLFGISAEHIGDWYMLKCDENNIALLFMISLTKLPRKSRRKFRRQRLFALNR